MNYLIQRGKVRGQVINVPDGLPEILSDITREVLRCQPTTECLCQFIIDYLHSIIVAREKARVAKYVIDNALKQVNDIISDLCLCHIARESCENMAAIMEESFRRFLEKYRCEKNKEKEIIKYKELDILDELIKRCKFSEEEMRISRPIIEEAYNRFVLAYMSAAETTGGTEALYVYFRDREIERALRRKLSDAAVKIQSNFRGFITRRNMFGKKPRKLEDFGEHELEEGGSAQFSTASQGSRFRHGGQLVKAPDECSVKSAVSLSPEAKRVQPEVGMATSDLTVATQALRPIRVMSEDITEPVLVTEPAAEADKVLDAEKIAKISTTTDTEGTPAEERVSPPPPAPTPDDFAPRTDQESPAEPAEEPAAESAPGPAAEPAPAPEPAAEPAPEPAAEPASQTAPESAPEPPSEPAPESTTKATPEPAASPAAEEAPAVVEAVIEAVAE